MKKTIITLFTIIFIVVTIICVNYYSYMSEYKNIFKENEKFEQYKNKEIYGIELGTIINKVIDQNTKNEIEKDEKNVFIPNEENSIQIEIYMLDSEQTYKMETFYNSGMTNFIKYYGDIKFKCSKIEYHQKTKRVKYILFEQVQSS